MKGVNVPVNVPLKQVVQCVQCHAFHAIGSHKFIAVEGNIYVGIDGGIVGGERDKDGMLPVTVMCTHCFIRFISEKIGTPTSTLRG